MQALLTSRPAFLPKPAIPRIERSLDAAVVPEARLAAFRRVTLAPDTGYLPITYPHVAAFSAHFANLLDPRFPLRVTGLVHVRSRILQLRPIGGGEKIRCIAFIEGQRSTAKGVEFDLMTEAYVGSERVWLGSATMLARQPSGSVAKTPHSLSLDGVGAVNSTWTVPASVARAYAFASGDLNPIHLSALTARLFGFKGSVAHGMWSLSRVAGLNPEWSSKSGVELGGEFKLPLLLPAKVVYRHWTTSGGLAFRLLDRTATKPHMSGTFRLSSASTLIS